MKENLYKGEIYISRLYLIYKLGDNQEENAILNYNFEKV